MAEIHSAVHSYEQAIAQCEEALRVSVLSLGREHSGTLRVLKCMLINKIKLGNFSKIGDLINNINEYCGGDKKYEAEIEDISKFVTDF